MSATVAEFCQKITEKDALRAAGHMSDEDTDHVNPDNEPTFINHPFAVKEPTNMEITMRIRVRSRPLRITGVSNTYPIFWGIEKPLVPEIRYSYSRVNHTLVSAGNL